MKTSQDLNTNEIELENTVRKYFLTLPYNCSCSCIGTVFEFS